MAKLKKCTDKDISMLLDTSSDSQTQDFDESYRPNESRDNNCSDSSNSEANLDGNKSLLLRTNALRKEKASLRLKLRRSTEQSTYKIDTDSEDERPKRSTRNAKRLKSVQDENRMPRKGARIIRTPQRYSDYECSSPQTPVLRRVKHINYNEEEMLMASLGVTDKRKKETKKPIIKNDDSNDSDCICVNFTPSTKSSTMSRSSKRNVSFQNIDDTPTSKIIRTRSLKCVIDEELKTTEKNKGFKSGQANVDNVPVNEKTRSSKADLIQHTSLEDTPKRKSERNSRRSILTAPNTNKSTMHKDEIKNKINEVDIICEVTKDLSLKTKQKKKDARNTTESLVAQDDFGTPKSHRASRHSMLTPSVKMRTEALLKPTTPLQEARSRLHVSAVPKSLPCREEEFNNIYTFLEGKLVDNIGGCIYISGVPGTGKTATVNEVIKCLKRSVEKGRLKNFDFVEINGLKLSEPRQAYVQILKQLSGKVLTWEQAHNTLEKRFKHSSKKKSMTLLLVDELDLLCTKRQDVIYNILDWPTKASARLVVITIANTMDLPERVLMGRVTSRLGLTRVTFQPYNHKQLQEIVITRLKDTNSFKNEAVQLIARKVSAVSGDARRALDICRRATEITETRGAATVTIQDVNEALSEMIANPKVQAIRHCSKFEQIFLQAVQTEVTRTGVEEVCFLNVFKQFESLCSFDGYERPNITQAFDICAKLGDYRLLICEYSSNDIYQRILLNISNDDIHYALQKIDLD